MGNPREDGPAYGDSITWEVIRSPCDRCRHLDWPNNVGACTAFPQGIPWEIRRGDHWHTTHYPGDHGILRDELPSDDPGDGEVEYVMVHRATGEPVGVLWWASHGEGWVPTVTADYDSDMYWASTVRQVQHGGATVKAYVQHVSARLSLGAFEFSEVRRGPVRPAVGR